MQHVKQGCNYPKWLLLHSSSQGGRQGAADCREPVPGAEWEDRGAAREGLCQQGANLGFLAILEALLQMQRFAVLSGCSFWGEEDALRCVA